MRPTTLLLSFGLALAATGALAQDSYFSGCHEPLQAGTALDLGVVRSEGEGVVQVFDYRTRHKGDLLGEATVHEGVNDVRVFTQTEVHDPVLAEIVVGGAVVASMVYDMCRADR